jgi:hypothetical protein
MTDTAQVVIEDLSDSALAEYFLVVKEAIAKQRKVLGVLEMTLTQRINATGGKALGSLSHEIRMVQGGSPSYSLIDLRMDLSQHLPPDELSACFNPETTIVRPESVDARYIRKIHTKYGGVVAEVIDKARTDTLKVKIERKEKE